jgi:uncharacterized protein YjiS (DUF1127 family)
MSTVNLNVTSLRSRYSSLWGRLKLNLVEWWHRAVSRSELTSLSERELWDIGLTRSGAEFESDKPFWRG